MRFNRNGVDQDLDSKGGEGQSVSEDQETVWESHATKPALDPCFNP